MSITQEGEFFPCLIGGGIGMISPFFFSKGRDQGTLPSPGDGYAGRSEDGAGFRL